MVFLAIKFRAFLSQFLFEDATYIIGAHRKYPEYNIIITFYII